VFVFQYGQLSRGIESTKISGLKQNLDRVSFDYGMMKEMTLQAIELNNTINRFVSDYTRNDPSATERNLKKGLSAVWASTDQYPKRDEVLSTILSQLKPAEKLVFNELQSVLGGGFAKAVEDKFSQITGGDKFQAKELADGYVKFTAFILTKFVVAYKNPGGNLRTSPSEERRFQKEYEAAAFETVKGADNIITAIRQELLSSTVSPLSRTGGGLQGALSLAFSEPETTKTLKDGIAKSYETFKSYKEYESLPNASQAPLASNRNSKKTEFFI